MDNQLVAPPEMVFADYASGLLALHDGWDSLHEFRTLTWDGTRIETTTLHAIAPDVPPELYPGYMIKAAGKEIAAQLAASEHTLYGFTLTFEGYAVVSPADLPAEERERLDADLRAQRLDKRPDSMEFVQVCLVDIHDRLWTARKERPNNRTHFHHYASAADAVGTHGGPFIQAMRVAALDVARQVHGYRLDQPFTIKLPRH
ncbi:hypothetical protein DQ384_26060 [Sphaerisporangium album]|uniref:Uncharacterized protein n=1 Tax=Sphaerisporangium album TaxID=509200 RepID=A0A367FBW5_9ACTN|nr:hypothetical protein [Sphaerisporangium album]RCG27187.1 hypothetical protein DQ384_26060 [Sphaerisporangium album]